MKKFLVFALFLLALAGSSYAQVKTTVDSSLVWQKIISGGGRFDISPDGQFIAVPSSDGNITIFKTATGDTVKQFVANPAGFGTTSSVRYSADGQYLVSNSINDTIIRIWKTGTWDLFKQIHFNNEVGVNTPVFATLSHNNKYLAAAMGNDGVYLWDFATSQLLKNYPSMPPIELNEYPNTYYVEFSLNDNLLAVGAFENQGRVIDITTDSTIIISHGGEGRCAIFSNDGTKFISASDDGHYGPNSKINIYDVQTRTLINSLTNPGLTYTISISKDDRYLNVYCSSPGVYYLWDLISNKKVLQIHPFAPFIEFSPDENYLIIGGNGIIVYDFKKFITFNDVPNSNPTELMNIYPNPNNSILTVEISLPQPKSINLDVTDLNGKQITSLRNGYFDSGIQKVLWNTNSVPNGTYFVTLSYGGSSFVKKVIINK